MRANLRLLLLIAFALMTQSLPVDAQAVAAGVQRDTNAITYTVSFPAPHTHYMEVSAVVPTAGRGDVEMMMAVWTPGSYLIREFERNVESVAATAPGGRA